MTLTGDSFLCGFEHKLWMIHQHILLKHGVYTIFRWHRRDVPNQISGWLTWFVPDNAPGCDFIVEWLKHELENEIEKPSEIDLGSGEVQPWPGFDVCIAVHTFSGIRPYMERDEFEKMATAIMNQMLGRLRKDSSEEGDRPQS